MFIFWDILVRNFFASLFAVVAIIKPVKNVNIPLITYTVSKNIPIDLILSKFIPVKTPSVIVSVKFDKPFGPIMEQIEPDIANIIASI